MKLSFFILCSLLLWAVVNAAKVPKSKNTGPQMPPMNGSPIGTRELPTDYTESQDAAKAAVRELNKKKDGKHYSLVEILSSNTHYRDGHEYNMFLKLKERPAGKSKAAKKQAKEAVYVVSVRLDDLETNKWTLVTYHHVNAKA